MVIEWLYSLLDGMAQWFLQQFPADPQVISFIRDAAGVIQGALTNAQGLGAWVDWAYLILVFGIVTGVWLIGILIKVIRWLIGLIPTMGGA